MKAKPINTAEAAKEAREYLGLSKLGLAAALRLGSDGRHVVRRIETGAQAPSGPYQIALEALVSGFRPKLNRGRLKLPIDKE